MTLLLNESELQELTGRSRRDAQARVLNAMGITHRARPDGTLVVSREHVDRLLGGMTRPNAPQLEPNWSAI